MDVNNFKAEKEAIGYRIRELRENFASEKISQEELGFRIGYAKKTIGELERGNTNPTFETLLLISQALNKTIIELFEFDLEEYKLLAKKYKENKKSD